MKWVDENWRLLDAADVIVIETQMRSPFLEMNTVIKTRFDGKVVSVTPRAIISKFRLAPKRALKKRATMQICDALFAAAPAENPDACDAALFILWYLDQHSIVPVLSVLQALWRQL
jgi:hypothetical protein